MAKARVLVSLAAAWSVVATLGLAAAGGSEVGAAAVVPREVKPKRVLMIVLDQLRPAFIDRYHMRNVQALMASGANFSNAYLGHMASETVVSHNVMTSGQLPKHMGWADEWYRDVDGVLGAPGTPYVSGSMGRDQFDALITHAGYPKLQDYLKQAFPDQVTATIGEKGYAVNAMSSPAATDIQVTFSGRDYDCDGDGVNNWRGPGGDNSLNVPRYLTSPECGRFYVNSDSAMTYGTGTTSPAWMYPLDGNRFVPGHDPNHLGGDTWVADAAMKVMRKEDWSGLFVTMGGIDKAGHMWGGLNDERPYPHGARDPMAHIAALARNADAQVGRLVGQLRRLGQLDDTLIVLTTDHAQQQAKNFYGEDGAGRGNYNWYYGEDSDEAYLDPQLSLQPLIDTGNVQMSMQDSAIRTWLDDTSRAGKQQAADVMARLPGVIASYYRTGDRYTLRSRVNKAFLSPDERAWFKAHAQELVDTEAAPYGPDVIGLLHDNSSYGVIGDHGGHQEAVQRIPLAFVGPGISAADRTTSRIRSVDIMPTVLQAMGIRRTYPTDGVAFDLP